MQDKYLSTESYKGVRDFYPAEAAIMQYIFSTWTQTAESFGYSRFDASILESAELYKAKGAENEELVSDQTYTFLDRGEREVTLRPEMTPTVARMIAAKQRELAFPVRWYSIPNLFRYERPQKGRLREHWQFNCDLFGSNQLAADVEAVTLAVQTMLNFGATPDQFVILLNDRSLMQRMYTALGLSEEQITKITHLNDRKKKLPEADYRSQLDQITQDETLSEEIILLLEKSDEQTDIVIALTELGITNFIFDKTLARGFNYYTGVIFEIFATDETGEATGRSLIGGGRYDNLTNLFSETPVCGVGFGMGDVALKDFLVERQLLPSNLEQLGTELVVIPISNEQNLVATKLAHQLRSLNTSVSTDFSSRKINKKIADAGEKGAEFIIVVGEDEVSTQIYTLKNLLTKEEYTGAAEEIKTRLLSDSN